MAHSNRQKLRDARGGKTRHQFRKVQRAAKYGNNASERIKELEAWLALPKEERNKPVRKGGKAKRVKRFSMSKRAIARRNGALSRIVLLEPTPLRAKEIATLAKRGAILKAA